MGRVGVKRDLLTGQVPGDLVNRYVLPLVIGRTVRLYPYSIGADSIWALNTRFSPRPDVEEAPAILFLLVTDIGSR